MKKIFWKVRLIVMGVNLGVAGTFAFIGWLLDQQNGTGVAYTFLSILISFPIAQIIVYKLVKKVV